MQGLAAANAKSATPFTTAGRVEQVGTWWCGYCDRFFACEGNAPLLTVRRRVPVVAARGNVSEVLRTCCPPHRFGEVDPKENRTTTDCLE